MPQDVMQQVRETIAKCDEVLALASALKPKPSRHVTKNARKAKRETKREETERIRSSVFDRAERRCEGISRPLAVVGVRCRSQPVELHHVFGRVRAHQSMTNCVALCRECHRDVTDNHPSAVVWWRWWSGHFERLGYTSEAQRARALLHKHEVKAQLGAKP